MVYLDHRGDRLLYRNGSQVSFKSLLLQKSTSRMEQLVFSPRDCLSVDLELLSPY
jgi:hypothetical protein